MFNRPRSATDLPKLDPYHFQLGQSYEFSRGVMGGNLMKDKKLYP